MLCASIKEGLFLTVGIRLSIFGFGLLNRGSGRKPDANVAWLTRRVIVIFAGMLFWKDKDGTRQTQRGEKLNER